MLRSFWQWLTNKMGVAEILCDRCLYDHPRACRNPERPNVSKCSEYKAR